MIELSDEQQAIVDAPLAPLAVVACAGSGKTHTAVYRLLELRRRLGDSRGRVALLSFSNVAVKTFRDTYQPLAQMLPQTFPHQRVEIDTLDGFITSHILRPHASRTMGCNRAPFLISGAEPFLQNKEFLFWAQPAKGPAFPVPRSDIEGVVANFRDDVTQFHYRKHNTLIPINNGSAVVARLGVVGAYTHSLGQYWAHRALQLQPMLLRALARRYLHILIDESQDIGTLHQAILEQLTTGGSQISLIGDPHQGIYEFAGANGLFLTHYGSRPGVRSYPLTRNYRSAPSIVKLTNQLSNRMDASDRAIPELPNGAYFIAYKKGNREQLIVAFQAAVVAAGLDLAKSAIVCRGRALAEDVAGTDASMGQGLVKQFARAAILRDKHQDYLGAFKTVAGCVVGLLKTPPAGLLASITQPAQHPEAKPLRREIWKFARSAENGLPSAALLADTEWHPLLLTRTRALLDRLKNQFALTVPDKLGNKLAKTELPHTPLTPVTDLATEQQTNLRVETVHKVKGESLDALLYLAEKDHVEALLAGVHTELGRIGYVAVTRARNLVWLGVPTNAAAELRPALVARGFIEAGSA